ncbi:MAG: carotenoid biosynthesis protein [Caldilineaceae bacterium]|nr:carotenoid biosynthesis protein [Caldilineaceae bacterium]
MKSEYTRWISPAAIALWVISTGILTFLPGSSLAASSSILSIGALVAFAMAHGRRRFGLKKMFGLFVIAVVLANMFENLSISTGFPFGHYVHTDAFGPKIFQVPAVVGPIFFSLCYIAWTLATMLIGGPESPNDLRFLIGTPIVASFIVTGWDMCSDPIGATIGGQWLFEDGGAYFGVPLSNYLGWYLTTWAIIQTFNIFLAIRWVAPAVVRITYWYEVAIFWAAIGMQYPILLVANPTTSVVYDTGGWAWRSGDILQNATIVSIYTMIAAAVTSALAVTTRYNFLKREILVNQLKGKSISIMGDEYKSLNY